MSQPLASYEPVSSQMPAPEPAPPPVTPAPAPVQMTVSQVEGLRRAGHISFQQAQQMLKTAAPDPVVAPPPMTPEQRIADDAKHGRISYQQELAAMRNPGAYTGPPGSQAAPTPAAAPAGPPPAKNLTAAPAAGAPGAAEGQGEQPPDLLAPFLRPGGAGGVAPHAVGYSAADKSFLGGLGAQQEYAGQNAEQTAGAIQSAADTYKNQLDALAAESKQGALDYQNHLNDQAAKRQQLQSDSNEAQRRVEAQLADLQAQNIDPNKYFHDRSTGQNLLGAILVGLGGFGAHALGPGGHDSTNTALEMMNNGIQREVDAQKTNLQKSLSVLGQRMNLNAQGFDQQKALLEAERESTQTAYQIAQNEIAKRAAQFKDNADVQTKAAAMIGGLRDSAANRIGEINGQIYQVQKAGEKIIGGGAASTLDPKELREEIKDYMKSQSEAGVPAEQNTPERAHAAVLYIYHGIQTPGYEPTMAPKQGKGGAASNARVLRAVEPHMNNDEKLGRMKQIIAGAGPLGYLNGAEVAELNTLGAQLRADHVEGIPDFSRFNFGRITGAQQASIETQQKNEKGHVANARKILAGGLNGPDESETPEIEGVDKEQ